MYLNKCKSYFEIICFIFKTAKDNKIKLKGITVVLAVLKCLEPFPVIIFPTIIIDRLISGGKASDVLGIILTMVVLSLIINLCEKSAMRKCNIMQCRLKNILHERLSYIVMKMDFEKLENDKYIQKIERAKVAVNGDLNWSVLRGIMGPRGINAICMGVVNIFVGAVQIICYIYILSALNIGITIMITLVVAVNSLLATKKKRIDFAQREKTSEMSTRMNTCHMTMDDIGMAKDIRLYDMGEFLVEKYKENREGYFNIRKKFFPLYFSIEEGALFVNGIQNAVIYMYLAAGVISKRFSIGYFLRYFSTITSLVKSFSMIIESVINISLFGQYMEDYYEIINENSFNENNDITYKHSQDWAECNIHTIKFENVWFRYPGTENYVLKNINLTIGSGMKVLIVGLNGAGKSTLVKLLLRLYKPTKGKIYINGININEISFEQYIKIFSAIFQDYKIYAESFKENIMFDFDDINRMEEIIRKLNINPILKAAKIQYDTNMSKEFDYNGVELSQGQKQKVVLARALFKKAKILILDEPTAALDAYSEYHIYSEFDKLVENRIVLYISHRLSAAVLCDNIIVIKNGEIIEQGSHWELLRNKLDYYEMYQRQAKNYK